MSYSLAPSPACPDAAVLARYHEQKLGAEAARTLAEHIKGCAHCQRRLARLDLLARSSDARAKDPKGVQDGEVDSVDSVDSDDEATIAGGPGPNLSGAGAPNTGAFTAVDDPRARPTDHNMPAVKGARPSRELGSLRPKAEKDKGDKEREAKDRPNTGTQYLEKGSRVGRYQIRDVIGVGGMGAVYSAYDPELNRRVALKVLRTRKRSGAPHLSEGRSRLMREAQAMARLSHPNIVTVFDVGSFEGEIYLAMELVDGTTLTTWLSEKKRSWKDVAKVFLLAGRGLAAAHAAGLVHRDFKPDNVLVGKDGRVRVMDFGLARPAGGADEDEDEDDENSLADAKERSLLNSPLTRKGILVGTPVYMAPEQFLNEPIDARADQFAFCVALYEALYGQLPFQGDNVEDLAHAIVAAKLPALPPKRAIPLVVHRVLRRGMRSEPRDRYASMDGLLRSLEWGIHFRPRASAAVAAAGLAAFVVIAKPFQNADRICPDPIGELAGVWDGARQKSVEAAFVATKAAFARDTYHSVQLALNDYARDWAAAKREACLATRVRREQSEDVLDLKYGCLDRRRHELDELVGLFLNADREMLQRSVNAASALSPVGGCADLASLAVPSSGPEQAELRASVSEQRAKLASASARRHAGKMKEALAIATEVSGAASRLKFRPLEAEALSLRGRLEEETGDFKASEKSLLDAATAAQAARMYSLAAEVLIDLTRVMGSRQGRTAEARHIGQLAAGAVEGLGNPDEMNAHLFENMSVVAWAAGDYQAAADYAHRSVELREKLHGPEGFEVARALNQMGVANNSLARYDVALGAYKRAIAIYEHVLGKDHPELANSLNNMGSTLTALERNAEADAAFTRALAIMESVFGKESPNLGPTLNNLANSLTTERRYDQALMHLQRALAITEKALGPEHPRIPPMLGNIAQALLAQGKTQGALQKYQQALYIREKALGPNHVNLANDLTGIGETYLAMGKPNLALAPLERALRLRKQTTAYPFRLADTQFALARALWSASGDKARALELAGSARDVWAEGGDKESQAQVQSWIDKHPLR